MSDPRGADYRTSAAPTELGSTCLLCGADGEAGKSCVTCSVAMPCIRCTCGVVNGLAAARCSGCSASFSDAAPRPRACPRCTTPLDELDVEEEKTVHTCSDCHGLFVPPRAWHLLIGRQDLIARLAEHLPAKREPPADVLLLDCPECTGEMERMRFAATSSVVIDVCPHQHGIWFDAGELAASTDYAQHRRAIGVEAALAEAERLQYRLAHEQALAEAGEQRRLAVTIAQPPRGLPLLEYKYPILAFLAVVAVLYGTTHDWSCGTPARELRTPARDSAEKSKREIDQSP